MRAITRRSFQRDDSRLRFFVDSDVTDHTIVSGAFVNIDASPKFDTLIESIRGEVIENEQIREIVGRFAQ